MGKYRIKDIIKIFIIESPSAVDILDGRNEGSALSKILELAGIKHSYFQVANLETLQVALERIADDINEAKSSYGSPIIHLSCHGNESGIGLTSGEGLTWEELGQEFEYLLSKIDRIPFNGFQYSPLSIHLSSCKGFYAKSMQEYSEDNLFTSLIGPIEAVDWSDSLMGFATLYHLLAHKQANIGEAMRLMNEVSGLDSIFQQATGKNMQIQSNG